MFISYLYRISSFFLSLFLLGALIVSLSGSSVVESERPHPCQISSIKHLEKSIAVVSRENSRFEGSLQLERVLLLISIPCPCALAQTCKWRDFEPFLIDRSYSRCNLAILSSKHHPPTS